MSGEIQVSGSVSIPESELNWRFSRSSGPGGQHVNTSATAAELSFDVANSPSLPEHLRARALDRLGGRLVRGVLTVRAEEYRSQLRNRDAARARLAALLADATAPPPKRRIPKKVPRGINERRLENKKRRSAVKRQRSSRWD
ncbi:alternative ribosome rescue aminoacyl-tRNA hydrolase ArfB [Actinomadura livida]|uniref:Alternative ribosome rescue aminoacyl-tRNA hydrolase ArfB n=1 Tax=Actinomadura livida TaxID=79909 RepID=A0A7W7I996_9ACTN|nr:MULTISPECIES: alternative ribosome rescue aminoacyl-tRNA hydrolase ArfB [Actinomadura]MBB4772765.1 ribosome-associated protein [Actinomadura catellatispora]GGU12582.1 aminoacyl-tRNA hydrolase [Actinomadura livida]